VDEEARQEVVGVAMFQEQPRPKKSLTEKLSRTWDKLAASKFR
jgi:hypothetical protein